MADGVEQKKKLLDFIPVWLKGALVLIGMVGSFFGGNQTKEIQLSGEPSYWERASEEQSQRRIWSLEDWRREASEDIRTIKMDVTQILNNQLRQQAGLEPLPSPRRRTEKDLHSSANTEKNSGG